MKQSTFNFLAAFTVSFLLTSCSKDAEDMNKPDLSPVSPVSIAASLTLSADSITANGVATAELLLHTDRSISQYYTNAVFTASNEALFSNGTATLNATLDNNGEARVLIHSSSVGTAVINVTVSTIAVATKQVYFTESYPNQLLVQPATATMPAGFSTMSITAKLLRSSGSVSEGTFVNFYDSTASGTSVGTFLNITTSNGSGEATAIYAIQDTSYHGFVYIKGTVITSGQVIRGFDKILVQ